MRMIWLQGKGLSGLVRGQDCGQHTERFVDQLRLGRGHLLKTLPLARSLLVVPRFQRRQQSLLVLLEECHELAALPDGRQLWQGRLRLGFREDSSTLPRRPSQTLTSASLGGSASSSSTVSRRSTVSALPMATRSTAPSSATRPTPHKSCPLPTENSGFYADWSGPSRALAPTVGAAADAYAERRSAGR